MINLKLIKLQKNGKFILYFDNVDYNFDNFTWLKGIKYLHQK